MDKYDLLSKIEDVIYGKEFDEKPSYDDISIIIGDEKFDYKLKQEFGKYYIVTK